ncbi:MAG: flagellar basal body-associated FliL family protein [Alphaproteobacteria bacterium]
MAEQTVDQAEGADAPAKKKKLSGKKIVMFAGPVVLLVGLYMSGMLDSVLGGGEEEAGHGEGEAAVEEHGPEISGEHGAEMFYLEMPEMTVNLRSNNQRPTYLMLEITLELSSEEAIAEVEHVLPRVIDQFQTHLRELHAADLEGSAAVFRLREELLFRVNEAIAPARVHDILFESMLVQG